MAASAVDQAVRDAGHIDVLVSNAGETVRAPLRVPAGAPAEQILKACKEAPETEPFLMAEIDGNRCSWGYGPDPG